MRRPTMLNSQKRISDKKRGGGDTNSSEQKFALQNMVAIEHLRINSLEAKTLRARRLWRGLGVRRVGIYTVKPRLKWRLKPVRVSRCSMTISWESSKYSSSPLSFKRSRRTFFFASLE